MVVILVRWILRLALSAIYLVAGVPKLLDPWSFTRAIHNFRILPLAWIPPLAITLPVLEIIAALAVLTGVLYGGGVICLLGLSLAFAGGIASAIVRGLDIDCGCFGSLAHTGANLPHLALNLGTAAAGIILLVAQARRRRRQHSFR